MVWYNPLNLQFTSCGRDLTGLSPACHATAMGTSGFNADFMIFAGLGLAPEAILAALC